MLHQTPKDAQRFGSFWHCQTCLSPALWTYLPGLGLAELGHLLCREIVSIGSKAGLFCGRSTLSCKHHQDVSLVYVEDPKYLEISHRIIMRRYCMDGFSQALSRNAFASAISENRAETSRDYS